MVFVNSVERSSLVTVTLEEDTVAEKFTKPARLRVLISIVPFPLFVAVTVALGAIKVVRLAAIEISVLPPITV